MSGTQDSTELTAQGQVEGEGGGRAHNDRVAFLEVFHKPPPPLLHRAVPIPGVLHLHTHTHRVCIDAVPI